jgi:hypothetical protein
MTNLASEAMVVQISVRLSFIMSERMIDATSILSSSSKRHRYTGV